MANITGQDPLTCLPPEIMLRVLEYVPTAGLAVATRLSRAWNKFIDGTHQGAIYSMQKRTLHPEGTQGLRFLSQRASFARYFDDVESWKELCKRQTLLARNWSAEQPVTCESVLQIGNDPVWRFRADFKRRFFVSTSQLGGVNVTDMDSGGLLWHLPADKVRPYAHLEYQDGTAVWDREGNSLEVWKTDLEGLSRGHFERVAILSHDCPTRGFQLSYNTLCVVSSKGQGFVYDMLSCPPEFKTHMRIAHDAVGHLDQDEDVVVYSIGTEGYHFYDKATGDFLGTLQPPWARTCFHIHHPAPPRGSAAINTPHGPTHTVFPPDAPSKDRLTPIEVVQGRLFYHEDEQQAPNADDDDWGAGMLAGNTMVGVSRGGRVFVCSDWRRSLADRKHLMACSSLVETESEQANFDLGGWLSVKDNRVMFEVQDRVYVLALNEQGQVQASGPTSPASYAFLTSSAPQLGVPVSFGKYFCLSSSWRCRSR